VFEPTKQSSRAEVRRDLEVNITKLAKRLGGTRLAECLKGLAFADHEERGFSVDAHTPWVDCLLRHDYDKDYDKDYDRTMARLARRPIAIQGAATEVLDWFAEDRS
jgi:hypothetical protein